MALPPEGKGHARNHPGAPAGARQENKRLIASRRADVHGQAVHAGWIIYHHSPFGRGQRAPHLRRCGQGPAGCMMQGPGRLGRMAAIPASLALLAMLAVLSAGAPHSQAEEGHMQLVHRVIDGELAVSTVPVQVTSVETFEPPRQFQIEADPASKISPELQNYAETGMHPMCGRGMNETAENIFGMDCSKPDDFDNRYISVIILLEQERRPVDYSRYNYDRETVYRMIQEEGARASAALEAPAESVAEYLEGINATGIEVYYGIGGVAASVPGSAISGIAGLEWVKGIDTTEYLFFTSADSTRRATGINIPFYDGFGGDGTRIASIDTGVDIVDGSYNHTAFTAEIAHDDLDDLDDDPDTDDPKVVYIRDMISNRGYDPDDCANHGTRVVGAASGTGSQDPRFRGFAPQAELIVYASCKTVDQAVIDIGGAMRAINDIIDTKAAAPGEGADVLTISYVSKGNGYGRVTSVQLTDMVYDSGIAITRSAGNNLVNPNFYDNTGDGHKVFTAGQLLANGEHGVLNGRPTSNYGTTLDGRIKPEITIPVAPMTVPSTGNTYQASTGTSFAAPAVAGAMATMIGMYKEQDIVLEPGHVYAMMLSQAGGTETGSFEDIHMDERSGAGVMGMNYDTMETHSGSYTFNSTGNTTVPLEIPGGTVKITAALWWPEVALDNPSNDRNDHNEVHLHIVSNGSALLSSTHSGSVLQRLVLEDPVPGEYDLQLSFVESEILPQKVFYSYTLFTEEDEFVMEHAALSPGGERIRLGFSREVDPISATAGAFAVPGSRIAGSTASGSEVNLFLDAPIPAGSTPRVALHGSVFASGSEDDVSASNVATVDGAGGESFLNVENIAHNSTHLFIADYALAGGLYILDGSFGLADKVDQNTTGIDSFFITGVDVNATNIVLATQIGNNSGVHVLDLSGNRVGGFTTNGSIYQWDLAPGSRDYSQR
ncbi:subtilisin-like serine protease [Cenarchaeum symbiosum A]|uniref:Subtilisin-like serine protease n=1 Tax=Cenarchaeum symbiosum (strain A) TaxID=414004 RepID=A0RUK1_CENSY|nr:subtilisin-like serine protease [Cenarchaeum symbiosum A]